MIEAGNHKEQYADWHPEPEADDNKPTSRWKGALSAAKGLGSRAREATRNFDPKATLAQAREQVAHAAERGMETATEAKDSIIAQFEDGRLHQLLETIQNVLTSPEAVAVLKGLPFASGAIKFIEAGKGSTFLQAEELSGFGRVRHAIRGTKDLAVDVAGGKVVKTAKLGAMLLELAPDILARIGAALKAKKVRGAETIVTLATFMQEHPGITNFFSRKFSV